MPTAATRRFGALDYDESSVLSFPFGLPGFDHEIRFALVEQPQLAPIVYLQSLQSADLCFLAAPARTLDPGYALNVTRDDLDRLGLDPTHQPEQGREVLCLILLCAPENGLPTANFLAPVVVNLASRVAAQTVRADSRYSHRQPLDTSQGSSLEAPCS
jgi:flagellar assembly factor FliW